MLFNGKKENANDFSANCDGFAHLQQGTHGVRERVGRILGVLVASGLGADLLGTDVKSKVRSFPNQGNRVGELSGRGVGY